jgi:hypothetical protein
LKREGVSEGDIRELEVAINQDGLPPDPNKFGETVSQWIAKMMGLAASGVWQVSIGVAGSLLSDALGAYYGWGV